MLRSTLFALAGLSFVLTACGGSAADSSAVAYRESSGNFYAARAFSCDLTTAQKQGLLAALDGGPDDGAAQPANDAANDALPSLSRADSTHEADPTTAEQPCSEQQYLALRKTVVAEPSDDPSLVSTEFQLSCSLEIVRGAQDSQKWILRRPDHPIRTQAELREWLNRIERMGARCLPEA